MPGAGTTGGYRSSPPPPSLLRAIQSAAKRFNVPAAVLVGIWRGESGSTYPNPAVNPSGYGGLFGTKDWNGTTQAQANYAASILHNALVSTKGNLQAALNIYQTGNPNKSSYSLSQFGIKTAGVIVPGYGQKGKGSSILGKIETGAGAVLTGTGNPVGGFIAGLAGRGGGIHPFAWVDKLIYAAAIAGGGFVTILGILLTAADVGLSTRAGKVAAAIPAGRAITKAARPIAKRTESPAVSEKQANTERRAEEKHQANLKLTQARATELRTRQRNRRKTKKEQEELERKAYYRGATDAASPTMVKVRRGK